MSFEHVEIHSAIITFDKHKTKEYRTDYNRPCDCQDCRNYYKHIAKNRELVEFLTGFGIDYNCTEEVFSWDLGNDEDAFLHHEAYYGVFGKIEGEEFDFEKFDVKIAFQKDASIPYDRTGEFFWICIEGNFPYILDEKRDWPVSFSQKMKLSNIISKMKEIFRKK